MGTDGEIIFEDTCKLLEPFNKGKVKLSRETDISADLQIDSVTVMDFIMEVEDRFDIDIPLNLLSDTRTLDDLVKTIQTQIAAQS